MELRTAGVSAMFSGESASKLKSNRENGPPGRASGYTAYFALAISRQDEEGFSSCSAHPCHHAVVTTPLEGFGASVGMR